ncbi:hypothetical protein MW7_007335 [Imbroritus primus]|uniref:Uncharacterized protein n=1 Tax=Imbroritus primus TaxID=3058603 RepID=A0ACD3SQS3_9BURK|nr:hypothetical protein MW7_007335 [Burkholderiaceae bacterium PBA]
MADTQTLKGLDDVLAKLKALPPEIVSRRGGVVRSALRKGALVIQKEAQEQVRRIVAQPEDPPYVSTKTLENAIVTARSRNPERKGANESYSVLVTRGKKGKYADGKTKAVATGRYLEFGTEKRAPTPWMAPAFMSARQRALDTVVTELQRGVARAIRKRQKGIR